MSVGQCSYPKCQRTEGCAGVCANWYGQWQWQCGYERGWDKAMEHKREWVGLTDEIELWEMWVESSNDVFRFARAIEAKLKEKNT